MILLQFLFSYCLPLCKQLQKINIDLKRTVELVENVVGTLKAIRKNYKTAFKDIYENVKVNICLELILLIIFYFL